MADEFFFSKAVLVWFQAEETTSDSKIFVGKLPQEQRIDLPTNGLIVQFAP